MIVCNKKSLIVCSIMMGAALCGGALSYKNALVSVSADAAKTVTLNGTTFEIDKENPLTISNAGTVNVSIARASFGTNEVVVFTPSYYYMDTPAAVSGESFVEYVVEGGGAQKIAKVSQTGGNEIPTFGYVVRIPKSETDVVFEAQQNVSISNVHIAAQTVDNITDRVRLEISHEGTTLTNTMAGAAYTDEKVGPSIDGNNLAYTFAGFKMITTGADEKIGNFTVTDVIAPNSVKEYATPENGFTLFALPTATGGTNAVVNNAGYLLASGKVFSSGDEVVLSGRDYFKFDFEVYTTYDQYNPGVDSPGFGFPENRGDNEFNIYTQSMVDGSSTLQTNIYGFEVAVDKDGYVVSRANNVGDIPEGGFIISAHGLGGGRKANWLQANTQIGYHVAVDTSTKSVTISSSLRSVVAELETKYSNLTKNINNAITRLYDVNQAKLQELNTAYSSKVNDVAIVEGNKIINGEYTTNQQIIAAKIAILDAIKSSVSIEDEIGLYVAENPTIEGHTIWHVPNVQNSEESLQEMQSTFDIYKRAGINEIILQVTVGGYTYYKGSQYFNYAPTIAKYSYGTYDDYLTAYMAEAEKAGIEVHLWITAFTYGRRSMEDGTVKSLYQMHPEWIAVDAQGNDICDSEGDKRWIDPANPEYRTYILGFIDEMFTKFPTAKGISLDYIRYPNNFDVGYTKTAMEQFLELHGYSVPAANEANLRRNFVEFVNSNADIKEQWNEFRRDCVSTLVKEVAGFVAEKYQEKLVSASVAISMKDAYEQFLCDWGSWMQSGWIDFMMPMSYINGSDAMSRLTKEAVEAAKGLSDVQMGVGTYNGITVETMLSQIAYLKENGASGFVLFSSDDLLRDPYDMNYTEMLETIYGGTTAISPNSSIEVILSAVFDSIIAKADKLYIPAEQMTEAQKIALRNAFDEIIVMETGDAEKLYKIREKVQSILDNVDQYASRYAGQRVEDALEELLNNIDLKINRTLIKSGVWDPMTQTKPNLSPSVPDAPIVLPEDPAVIQPQEEESKSCSSMISLNVVVILFGAVAVTLLAKKRSIKE